MSPKDKQVPLPEPVAARLQLRYPNKIALVALVAVLGLLACTWHSFNRMEQSFIDRVCPQTSELIPEKNYELWENLNSTYSTNSFKLKAVARLSGAVQVPTESDNYYGLVGKDPRWEKFQAFHDYLFSAFPLLHAELELTKINSYGLIFLWKGSNSTLKPLLLTAHQDVVPVNSATVDQWTHPPFSGYFDGENIWGRGCNDDKSRLIGIMYAIEIMLESGHKPTRTVVLTFGFDEESGGVHGARTLAVELENMFGENGYAMLVDEGARYTEQFGRVSATVGIVEKASINVRMQVSTPGGHSSLPPPHTSIGILAQLLVKVEANPFQPHLVRGSPVYKVAQCLAAHFPRFPSRLRTDILRSEYSDVALRSAEKQLFVDPYFKGLASTTQAIDIVQGGVKVNVLPEKAWAVINHRISMESSVNETKSRITNLLAPIASAFNLSYTAFGASIDPTGPAYGNLTLSAAFGKVPLGPVPISPTDGSAPYELLSGTIKAAYNSHRGLEGNDHILIIPGVMLANTDSKHYWKLTPHIFRYAHALGVRDQSISAGIHTINEVISADHLVEIIRFFTTLILNVDESALL